VVPYELEVPYSICVTLLLEPPKVFCGTATIYHALSLTVPSGTSNSSNKFCLGPD